MNEEEMALSIAKVAESVHQAFLNAYLQASREEEIRKKYKVYNEKY